MGLTFGKINEIIKQDQEREPELISYKAGDLVEINLFNEKTGENIYKPSIKKKLPYLASVIEFDRMKNIKYEGKFNDDLFKLSESKILILSPFDAVFTEKNFKSNAVLVYPEDVMPCYFQRDLLIKPKKVDIVYEISKIEPQFNTGRITKPESLLGVWFIIREQEKPDRSLRIEYLDLIKYYDLVWE